MPTSRPVSNQKLDTILRRVFFCPSCTNLRLIRKDPAGQRINAVRRRFQSSLASTTAINGVHPIPTQFKPLHDALLEVRKKAAAHVSLSRLQLALQSLESTQPTIRLAILGLDIPDTARRIARLILADALEDEGAWEKQLTNGKQDFSRGLVIRYGEGENPNIPQPRTSVPILYVPAYVLQKHNIEILVSSVNGLSGDAALQAHIETPSDAFLSPAIGTPTSESGRQVTISQPAHKCLLVVQGIDQLVAAAELLAATKFTSKEDRESVMVAVNIEGVVLTNPDRATLVTDVTKAEEGLAAIRKSVTLATDYEHKWIDSGMPALSKWLRLSAGSDGLESATLTKPVRDLVVSLLTATASSLRAAAQESTEMSAAQSLEPAVGVNLGEVIDQFSRLAHQELQSGLASAWKSRNWRKLAWYKLFWRVDDVGLIVTDLVSNAWLPNTERAVYELSGRLVQVGINPVTQTPVQAISTPIISEALDPVPGQEAAVLQPATGLATAVSTSAETQPTQTVIVNQIGTPEVRVEPIPQPVPISTTISRSRAIYMSNAITSLTTTAQQLVLRTLSIAGLSAGLSGLTYVSLFSSIYEAGTIAAIGAVFALWRMQGDWQSATKRLEDGLYNEGRSVIVDIVDRMKVLVEQRSVVEEDPVEQEIRQSAEMAVKRAKEELEKLDG